MTDMTTHSSADAVAMARILADGKAEDVTILDVRSVSTITDYFIVGTATSPAHLKALAKRLEDGLASAALKPVQTESRGSATWTAIDYGTAIVHLMLPEARRFYNLERLWGDAPRLDWETAT